MFIKIGNDIVNISNVATLNIIQDETGVFIISYDTPLGHKKSKIFTDKGLQEFVMQLKELLNISTTVDMIKEEAIAKNKTNISQ